MREGLVGEGREWTLQLGQKGMNSGESRPRKGVTEGVGGEE